MAARDRDKGPVKRDPSPPLSGPTGSPLAVRGRAVVGALGLALTLVAGAPLAAQTAAADPVSASLRTLWSDARDNLIAAARLVSEPHYEFRPAEEVRTFGALVAHVADSQYFFCSAGLDEPNPNEPNHRPNVVAPESLEATLDSKAEIVAALEASLAYCDPLYEGAGDDALHTLVTHGMPGQPRVRPLVLGLYHVARHYGNVVVYMRSLGYVPPSSSS